MKILELKDEISDQMVKKSNLYNVLFRYLNNVLSNIFLCVEIAFYIFYIGYIVVMVNKFSAKISCIIELLIHMICFFFPFLTLD